MAKPLYKKIQSVIMKRLNGTNTGEFFQTNDFVKIFTNGTWAEFVRTEPGRFKKIADHTTNLRASRATVMKALKDLESQGLIFSTEDPNYSCLRWASEEALRQESLREDDRYAKAKAKAEQTRRDWVKARVLETRLKRKGIKAERRKGWNNEPILVIPADAFEAFEEFMARAPKLGACA